MYMCACKYICVYIYDIGMYMCVCACMYMYVYIFFVFRVDINQHHEVRSTSNFWCQRIIMIALKCDIVLSESKI